MIPSGGDVVIDGGSEMITEEAGIKISKSNIN